MTVASLGSHLSTLHQGNSETWQDYRRSSRATNPTGHVDSYVVVGNPLSDDHRFPSIPGSAREAKAVAAILGSEALIGAEARKSAVLLGLDQARLVYFATHGEARGETVEAALDESFLLLADGTLTARDIQHLKLNAELAVLSACQTGLGVEHSGGTIGLARAFQLAGIPRVLMSLWSVDDDATEFLMTRFMKYRNELGDFRALRQAMQEAKETYKHPALWAGFSFFGVNLL